MEHAVQGRSGRRARWAKWARGARWARWAAWSGGLFALIGVLGFLLAPPLVKSLAESALGEALRRPVTIDGISLNPYALSAEVRGLRILEKDGGAPAASFASLYVNLEAESLLRGGVVVRELTLVEPSVRVLRLEGRRSNWSDVVETLLARPDDGKKSAFAVHNIRIENGRIDFEDRPSGQKHVVAGLSLGLPFVSNLPSQVDTFVEPKLAMQVDRAPFEIHARAKPFAANRESVLSLKFDKFDLRPWLAYLPGEASFLLPGARLSSTLEVSFRQPAGEAPGVSLAGSIGLDDVDIRHLDGSPAIRLPSLRVVIERFSPLARELVLAGVHLEKPEIHVTRQQDSQISLRALIPKLTREARAVDAGAAPPAPEKPFALSIKTFTVSGGRIALTDELASGRYHKQLQDLHLSLSHFSLAGSAPAALDFGFSTDDGERYRHQGTLALAPLKASGTLEVERLDVPALKPYFAAALKQAELTGGKLDAKLDYRFSLEAGDPAVEIKADSLLLSGLGLRLAGEKAPLARIGRLEIREALLDTVKRRLRVGEVRGDATRLAFVRDSAGQFNFERLLAGAPPPQARARPGAAPPPTPKAAPAWQVEVNKIALDDWGLRVEDRTLSPPVVLDVEPLALKVDGLSSVRGSKATLALQAAVNRRGKVGVAGSLSLAPLAGSLDLDLQAVDLAMLQPYLTEKVKIAITRGHLSSRGRLAFALPAAGGVTGGFRGTLTVGDFASVDKLNAADFLKWKSLSFGGLDLRLAPLALSIDDIVLSDFYTRLILDAKGGLNLREITAREAGAGKGARAVASAAPAPGGPAPLPSAAAPGAALPPILVKRVTLSGGNIAYSDRFIRPNYDANLTGMGGRLTGLSSDPDTVAELELRGKVDDAAPVEVRGRLNPFRQDKALDIQASVKDFELEGVSTYAAKYVGYGIEKGKLSARLGYRIVDRKLTATNQVFLDQLTFGKPVDSPDALKLPVLLAVSLLKNSRGEIDLDLPVGGSLDDPEFSVGGLVVRVIVNLLGKALTSPFALLGSLFGANSEELAWLEFEPGFARLSAGAETKLQAIARAMNEKSGLKLEIFGRVDPATDREGLKRAALAGKVEAVKVKDMARRGESLGEGGRVRVAPAEYPALLTRVYKEEKFPKPRNLIGLARDLPVAEMETLILAHSSVGDEDLQLLGRQRAQAAKNWLLEQGSVPAERIFLIGAREGGEDDALKASRSRVDFSLR